ncbi:MAG: uroporphyrinogen-III synthase [Cyanobacteria bacterium SW_12_48_29]|nr:MAG: uroporphyrinogen-III synthase [Cyanobacteria bacterium SW_12_48_29]
MLGDKGSRGAEEQKRKKTRGHGDAGTRGAAGHTDLRTEISRVGGNLEPRVLVSATDTSAPASSSPLTPHTSLQLTGKTVLVTRSAKQSSNFTNLLQQQGATVIEMPAIEICPPSSWEELDSAIAYLQDFHWLILTSANGVEYFCNRLIAKGLDARALAGVKIAVVGKKTAATLKKWGLQPDFIPSDFVADSLAEEFPEVIAAQKLLFPRVETGGREVLVQQLTAQGAEVVEVAAYQSGCPAQISPTALQALQQQAVDVITFASSKTVKNFSQLLEAALTSHSETNSLLKDVCIASIGPQTSHACRKCLGRCDIEAEEYTLEGLTQAVVQWVRNNSPNFEV